MRLLQAAALFVFIAGARSLAAEEPSELVWGAGGGVVSSPRPYVGAQSKTIPVPAVRLDYGRWFFQGIRGGYELFQRRSLRVNTFAQVRFQGLDPEDSPFLADMEPRKKSLDGGLELLYQGRPVGFRLSAVSDVLGRSKGQELSAQAITGAPLGKRVLVLAGFGPTWDTARRVDYYYGVRPGEATPSRPAYSAAGTWSWDLSLSTIYRPSERWSLFASWNRSALGSAIRESPIVDRDSAWSFVMFLTRDF